VALASVDGLRFSYGGGTPVLDGVSLEIADGEHIALLGPSGSGKSTLLRALAALVPHFHGGRFEGRVVVGGIDTREARPAELAGTVASVFQDPEDQIVMSKVANETAFGLENLGVDPKEIWPRVEEALALVGAEHLVERATGELSGGELQRVSLASALALKPRLLLLDEPTSQLDPESAEAFFDLVEDLPCAVLVSEQRPARPLAHVDRVLFMDAGRIVLDASRDDALVWLAEHRPLYLPHAPELVCSVRDVRFAYGDRVVLERASLEVHRGEVVALTGPNGAGKTTLARIAAGLLEPDTGEVTRSRSAYLAQDPGRHLVTERVLDEVALAADVERAHAALSRLGLADYEQRHPRDLSSGERERLSLAAVLATEPELLVLDEPTRGVDPERKAELARLLRAEAPGRGTLVVTHDLQWAAEVADRIVELDVWEGDPLSLDEAARGDRA
jgi:energy-coupling factor transport system ATP-binding protein